MDLSSYRASPAEQERTSDLLRLLPARGHHALDVGARDGHFSLLMAQRFDAVTALDLVLPRIAHPKVSCVRGSAAALPFPAASFDLVFCAEVLEHIPSPALEQACLEMERVCCGLLVIGVPYKQDIRVGRTTCQTCGNTNPPWGHVNTFDEKRLENLFPGSEVVSKSFVGTTRSQTNALGTALMDLAGNPYGNYEQEEPCIHCGAVLAPPSKRNFGQKVATKLAFWAQRATAPFAQTRGNWIHLVLRKAAPHQTGAARPGAQPAL
jgi:Methyltransferase domain